MWNTRSARSSTDRVVLKLGGSLLDLPELSASLRSLLHALVPSRVLLITGGGRAADTIRRLDQKFSLTSSQAHWWAIAAMSWNARMLCRVIPGCMLVAGCGEADIAFSRNRIPVLDALTCLQLLHAQQAASVLPGATFEWESWDVTSDSLAAMIARTWRASEVVLAKSCDPRDTTVAGVAEAGQTDPQFPICCAGLKTGWCNLRTTPDRVIQLT